jgi:hypothetical protein
MDPHDYPDLPAYLNGVLTRERPIASSAKSDPNIVITDDQPFNEYYLLRQNRLYAP